ncbi:cell wall-binding repeat-containing protein [Pontibacillus salicampi]|uniref:Cell wall-binding repeat-containing protein n=1 Tax=Pontibacillus salicampi TaxID=1449801 RepID=A0ABV6LSD9_9BACI
MKKSIVHILQKIKQLLSGNKPMEAKLTKAGITYHDVNQLLSEAAIRHNIPPEIIKAIAYKESNWNQWVDDEQTIPTRSSAGAIGIMQVYSNICKEGETEGCYNKQRLERDIAYNIDAGCEILNQKWNQAKWNQIPMVNDGNRNRLESWYFALLAYNGQRPRNNPFERDGNRKEDTYQDGIFSIMEQYSLATSLAALPLQEEDFYEENNLLRYRKLQYEVDTLLTKSRQMYQPGDIAYVSYSDDFKVSPSAADGAEVTQQMVRVLSSHHYIDKSTRNNRIHFVRYNVELENGQIGYMSSEVMEPVVTRISGKDRYETSAALSREGFWEGASTVVLVRGDEFTDALAGTPLAYKLDAPILLTRTSRLPSDVKEEIDRLRARKVILLGGENAIGLEVEMELRGRGLDVQRIAGSNRYETAARIAEMLGYSHGKAILAYGDNFPDALTIAPYAAQKGIPILLTKTDVLPDETRIALERAQQTIVIGGTGIISESVMDQVPGEAIRLAGRDRYETAQMINEVLQVGNRMAMVTTGEAFPDSLAVSVLAARRRASVLIVKKTKVPDAIEKLILENLIEEFSIIGGTNVIDIAEDLKRMGRKIRR